MNNRYSGAGGIGLLDAILLINIILKLVGVIDWSWKVVLWPLWVSIGLIILFLIIVLILLKE